MGASGNHADIDPHAPREDGFATSWQPPKPSRDPRMAGMKRRQRDIAAEIERLGECTLRQVAENLGLSTNGVSQTCDTLAARGLIRIVKQAPPKKSIIDAIFSWVPFVPPDNDGADEPKQGRLFG